MAFPFPQSGTPVPEVHTLPNGLRVVALPMPWRHTVNLSVFVRAGSLHEPARLHGISHVVEHMAFKGTDTRDCQRINLDAERLGAEVNAHTDKDHTAYHIEGLPRDTETFIALLADIVLNSTFPQDEFERERQVILHELTETEEDPVAIAFQLFDRACFGRHPAGQPVIGRRTDIQRLARDDLLQYVHTRYSACNLVVGAAGPVEPETLLRSVERAFGAMPRGIPNAVSPAPWQGGLLTRAMAGCSQCQIVVGHETPPLADERHLHHVLAAAVLGEGMSSPLLDQVRERRGLAYHVGCYADVQSWGGQFVVEAATDPEQAEAVMTEVKTLCLRLGDRIPAEELARARRQLAVRTLKGLEQAARRLEQSVQDLFTLGRLQPAHEWLERLHAIDAAKVRAVFAAMPAHRPAVALAGSVKRSARVTAREQLLESR